MFSRPCSARQTLGDGYKPTRRFGRAREQDGWFNIDKVNSLKFRTSEIDSMTAISIGEPSQELPVAFEPGGAVPGDRCRCDGARRGDPRFSDPFASS